MSDGRIDENFGFNGSIILDSSDCFQILEGEQGYLYVFSNNRSFVNEGERKSIERLMPNGFYDLDYGVDGYQEIDIAEYEYEDFEINKVIWDENLNGFIAAGEIRNPDLSSNSAALFKIDINGNLDTDFDIFRIPIFTNYANVNIEVEDFFFLNNHEVIILVRGRFLRNLNDFYNSRLYKVNIENNSLVSDFGNEGRVDFFDYCSFCEQYPRQILNVNSEEFLVAYDQERDSDMSYTAVLLNKSTGEVLSTVSSPYISNVLNTKLLLNEDRLYINYTGEGVTNTSIGQTDFIINGYFLDSNTLSANDYSLKPNKLLIYPNPVTNDKLMIRTEHKNLSTASVYGTSGNFVKNITLRRVGNELELDLKGLPEGVYFINLNATLTFKIIKK